MKKSTIRYQCYPKTEPPPDFAELELTRFRRHLQTIDGGCPHAETETPLPAGVPSAPC